MDNKTLATELITRYAGLPHPMRGMIQEAARRLLQMAPDYKSMAGKMEADSLRQLATGWPLTDKPWITSDWTADDWLRCVCTAAADRIEQMAEAIDYGRQIQAERDALKIDKINLTAMVEQLEKIREERDAMAAALKARGGCDTCKHCDVEWNQEPCDSCRQDDKYPKWEWKGA